MPLNFIAGTADQVYREVTDLANMSQADEVMITTTLPNVEDRRRTLLSMAEQFALSGCDDSGLIRALGWLRVA